MKKLLFASVFLFPFAALPVSAEEPALPMGLGGGTENAALVEPALPEGLSITAPQVEEEERVIADSMPFTLTGFGELRAGVRLSDQPYEKRASIGEARLQLQAEKFWDDVSVRVTSDFIADPVADRWAVNLDNGDGWVDLREAFFSWRATDYMDVKAGRQILTWGTGDMIFLNDMFPKDFDSFFIGRDEEYLKAPSDSVKTSFFNDFANLDVVYTPNFDSDRYADGARVSTYNPFTGGQTGRNNVLNADERGQWFSEDEWAARLYRNIGAYEVALYGYDGYWKNPQGLDVATTRVTFPRLSVYGGSVRGPVAKGIANAEIAYYDSRDDNSGINPVIPNDQFRVLAGYEQEVLPEFTVGVQYNLERTLDYDELVRSAPAGSPLPDENRHVTTLRLTKLLMNQDLTLSLFNYWSPSDQDGYIRPKINYKINDQWTAETGGNIFYGEERSSFFGQLEDNTNVYAALRYSF